MQVAELIDRIYGRRLVRVLIVADVVGGVRTFTAELVAHSPPAGRRCTSRSSVRGGRPWARVSAPPRARCVDLRLEWMEDPWDDVGRAASGSRG